MLSKKIGLIIEPIIVFVPIFLYQPDIRVSARYFVDTVYRENIGPDIFSRIYRPIDRRRYSQSDSSRVEISSTHGRLLRKSLTP